MKPRVVWTTLTVIIIAWWLAHQGYEGNFFKRVDPVVKHGINFSLILIVAGAGYLAFFSNDARWYRLIWSLVYLFIILLIAIFGAIDLFSRFSNQNVRDFFGYLRMFFTGPMPFAILLLLMKMEKQFLKQ